MLNIQLHCFHSGSQGPFLGSWLETTYGGGSTGKCSTWEAGHREPTVLTWPNVVKPNTVSDALTSALDIFPTFLSAAGAPLPPDRKYDGMDLNDFLSGKTTTAHYVSIFVDSERIVVALALKQI